SMARPSCVRRRSLRVPSLDVCTVSTASPPTRRASASRARKGFESVVISSHDFAPRAWRPWKIWSARKRGSPSSPTRATISSCVRSSASRTALLALGGGEIGAAEEERDLLARRLGPVGAVDRIPLDVLAELGADRPGRRLAAVGRAHDLAVPRDRVLALEHLDDDRPLGHELDEVAVERPLAVDGVERLRLCGREAHHLLRDDAEAAGLEQRDDLAHLVRSDGVGLHDRESLFHFLSFIVRSLATAAGLQLARLRLARGSPFSAASARSLTESKRASGPSRPAS